MNRSAEPVAHPRPLTVIVAGAVGWTDSYAIRRELAQLPAGSCVIHGDCAGADALGGQVAHSLGLRVELMQKNVTDEAHGSSLAWKRLNEHMIARMPDLVLIFHHDFATAQGSRHLWALARQHNINVRVCPSADPGT